MQKLKKINSCGFFHQTSESNMKSIIENGFVVESGGNQRFTEGIYFLKHPEGEYGEKTIRACVQGNFLDLTDDEWGDTWRELKKEHRWKNYAELTDYLKKESKADGIIFPGMLVVWDTKKIKDIHKI